MAPTSGPSSRGKRGRQVSVDTIIVQQGPKRTRIDTPPEDYQSAPANDPPRHPAYHKNAVRSKKTCIEIIDDMLCLLRERENAGYDSRELQRRCVQLRKLRSRLLNPAKPIAFVGPAGAGKSAIISCLLDQPGLAISDNGPRGTNVVHEYLVAKPGQQESFLLDAHYHTDEEIRKNIKSYCQDVIFFNELREYRLENPEDVDDDEYYEKQKQCTAAVDRLYAMLCQYGFTSVEGMQDWLSAQSDDIPAAVTKILEIVQQYLDTRDRRSGIESRPALSIDELHTALYNISRPPPALQNSLVKSHPWPLVKKARVRHEHSLLRAGAVIADTPGISDSDPSIVETTTSYMKKEAGYIVLVTPVSRCNMNVHFDEMLRLCIRLGKMERVIACFTFCDQVDAPVKAHLPQADGKRLTSAEEAVKELEAQITDLTHRQTRLVERQQYHELGAVYAALKQLADRLRDARRAVKHVEIDIRNHAMASIMKDRLRQLSGLQNAPDLKMIFTSAKEYAKHISGPSGSNDSLLDIETTGITDLKQVIYRIAGDEQMKLMTEIITTKLPAEMEKILACHTNTPFEKHRELRARIVEVFRKHREAQLSAFKEDSDTAFQNLILQPFPEHAVPWQQTVFKKMHRWSEYHVANYHAFCRKHGYWKQPKKDAISWNGMIQSVTAHELGPRFMKLSALPRTSSDRSHRSMDDVFDTLQSLSTSEGIPNESDFSRGLKAFSREAHHSIDEEFRGFEEDIEHIRGMAVVDDQHSISFIGQAMEPAYRLAANIESKDYAAAGKAKGRVAHNARVGHIKATARSLWDDVPMLMKELYDERRDLRLEGLEQTWLRSEQDVLASFDHRYEAALADDGHDRPSTQHLKDAANNALETLRGSILRDLEECEEWAGNDV